MENGGSELWLAPQHTRLRENLTEQRLAQAEQRIASMESSWFWRARKPWAKLTGR